MALNQQTDDLFLLDVVGGANVSVLHPHKPIVAYTAGKISLDLRAVGRVYDHCP
jgi:hypothetical protein